MRQEGAVPCTCPPFESSALGRHWDGIGSDQSAVQPFLFACPTHPSIHSPTPPPRPPPLARWVTCRLAATRRTCGTRCAVRCACSRREAWMR